MFDKLLLKQLKNIIREYKLTTQIKMSRLVDGKRKPYTKKELSNELHNHLEIRDDGEIIYKSHDPMKERYLSPQKKVRIKEDKGKQKEAVVENVVIPKEEPKIITWNEIVKDKTIKKIPYIQGNILQKFLKVLTSKQIFNSLNNINKNTWLLNEDFLGNKNVYGLKKNKYIDVIHYLVSKKIASFDEIYFEILSQVISTLPKKKIQSFKDYVKEYWKKRNIDEPIEKPAQPLQKKEINKPAENPIELIVNEWDSNTLPYILEQNDKKLATDLTSWIDKMNAKGKDIFDDLGLQFFKKYNNEVFEKWGATILFDGIRRIFKHFGAEKVVDMDNPPIPREIKKGVVNEINRKKLQKEEVKKER